MNARLGIVTRGVGRRRALSRDRIASGYVYARDCMRRCAGGPVEASCCLHIGQFVALWPLLSPNIISFSSTPFWGDSTTLATVWGQKSSVPLTRKSFSQPSRNNQANSAIGAVSYYSKDGSAGTGARYHQGYAGTLHQLLRQPSTTAVMW